MVTIYIVTGFLICFLGIGYPVHRMLQRKAENTAGKNVEESAGKSGELFGEKKYRLPVFTAKDLFCMLGVTLAGGIFLFFRLGSFEAPRTGLQMEQGTSHEMVLDMGGERYVESIHLFLGHTIDRTMAVSYYDENSSCWVPIWEEQVIEGVYDWAEIPIGRKVEWLGIVSRNENAEYKEIVLQGEDGETFLPANAYRYKEAFDEQELLPKDKTYYYRTMFDEVYYASSAYQLLNGMNMMEYTHPPMGKILMAIGVKLFGVTPFGWRCVCALFGALLTPVIYLFAHRLTGRTKYAVFASLILNLDFMHYTLSRIATLDAIVAFFILAMFTVMYYHLTQIYERLQNPESIEKAGAPRKLSKETCFMLLGALVSGMAVATKWTGFYAFFGIFVLFLVFYIYQYRKNKGQMENRCYLRGQFWKALTSYGIITPVIYVLSFIPVSKARGWNLLDTFMENNFYMLSFHSDIVFEHPYESAWYTWPLDLVPLVDAGTILSDNTKVQFVATFGNPVIWWIGLLAFVFLLYRGVFEKDRKAAYLSAAYLSMLVPWFFITRTVFIYQYYACAILLSVILAYALTFLEKRWKSAYGIMLELALICMIIFYPVISGYPVYGSTVQKFMQWFTTWKWL